MFSEIWTYLESESSQLEDELQGEKYSKNDIESVQHLSVELKSKCIYTYIYTHANTTDCSHTEA
jgi:hypothetical protein